MQARVGSSRLRGKVLADLAGQPMLAFMLQRLTSLAVDELVVATSSLAQDDPVADVATSAGARVVRGSETDVLARFGLALDRYPADIVVRLTADCPLIDPAVVGDALKVHRARRVAYTSNTLIRSYPDGLDVEVISSGALRTAISEARDHVEREHVTPFVYRRPERFELAALRGPLQLERERWTVDTPDDLERVRAIVGAMPDTAFGWQDVLAAGATPRPPPAGIWLRGLRHGDIPGFEGRLDDPARRVWAVMAGTTTRGWVGVAVRAAVGTLEMSSSLEPDEVGATLVELQATLAADFQVERLEAHPAPGMVGRYLGAGFVGRGSSAGRVLWQRVHA